MTKVDDYRDTLRQLEDWDPYLTAESRLPGPRANLELAHAVALESDPERLARLRGSDHEFLVMCGVMGLDDFAELRRWAGGESDGEAALRKALSYGWSVAVVARPDPGRALMERWIADGDAGTRRIMRENLRKARLARLDGEWVERQLARI